ncbi:MAG TPA: CYTH domain-containing protein [Candidatus Obscuribacterales bacterium]
MTAHNFLRQIIQQWLRSAFRRFVRTSADPGHMEIERKFFQTQQEASQLAEKLKERGFKYIGTALMSDTFLPSAVQGEMLRVRQERMDLQEARTILTFKQWVKTATGKERRETERDVPPVIGLFWLLVGRFAAGHPLLGFSKRRQLYEGKLNATDAVVSIDEVSGLGVYSGWYLEIEVLQPLGTDSTLLEQQINLLANELFDTGRQPIMRSYRDMLIESTQT